MINYTSTKSTAENLTQNSTNLRKTESKLAGERKIKKRRTSFSDQIHSKGFSSYAKSLNRLLFTTRNSITKMTSIEVFSLFQWCMRTKRIRIKKRCQKNRLLHQMWFQSSSNKSHPHSEHKKGNSKNLILRFFRNINSQRKGKPKLWK